LTDLVISLLSGAGIKVIIHHERDRDEINRHIDSEEHAKHDHDHS